METQRARVPVDRDSVQSGHDASEETSGVVSVRDIVARAASTALLTTSETTGGTLPAADLPARPRPATTHSWRQRWRGLAGALLLAFCFAGWRVFAGTVRAPTLEQSLTLQLQREGLTVEQPANIVWLTTAPNWLGVRSALVSAHRERELHDIYYLDARVSGSSVIDVYSLTNNTRTSSADETLLVGARAFAAYAAKVGDAYDAVVLVDTRGEAPELTRSWPWYAKLQNAITNYQDTGRGRAFGMRRYRLAAPASALSLQPAHGLLHASVDGQPLVISPFRDGPALGAELAKFERANKGQPGTITWVVDTVRRVPAIGRAPIEWLEHTVFGVTDRITRAYHEFVKTDTAAEVKQALSGSHLPGASAPTPVVEPIVNAEHAGVVVADTLAPELPEVPENIGWPPAALTPVLPVSQATDKVAGEGAWLPVENDAFVASNANGPPLFYQTFIRVDPKRVYTRVYVTMWDPRQVQLGMVMGTKEPESATGETGNGMIPRDAYVMSHLVGAFNGGFQAMHGEFGMMAGKRVYLPPKPFAATVAVFEDGTTGMGSWPGPGAHAWDETFANSQIPKDMVAMRQNLTSVVEGGRWNPWERWWWGAAPEAQGEQTYIHRSGLCVTNEGFMGYFWGESMGPEELGKAMQAARCARGMHLDMNGAHTGFEFYQPFAKGQLAPDLGRALRPSEFEGVLGGGRDPSGLHYRSRLAVSTMSPLRFPRYINQDPRDYFYLTRKPTLPGADLHAADGSSIAFSTRGLPNTGFPHAFARARVGNLGWVVRVDVTRAVPKGIANPTLTRSLGYITYAQTTAPASPNTAPALYARFQYGRLRAYIGPASTGAVTLANGRALTETPQARVGLGVDADGFVVYAEAKTEGTLPELFRSAGVNDAIALSDGQLALQDETGLHSIDGQALPAADAEAPGTLALMGEERPAARVLFDDVTPMPYRKWGGMQDQRVRYFPNHPARFLAPDAAR